MIRTSIVAESRFQALAKHACARESMLKGKKLDSRFRGNDGNDEIAPHRNRRPPTLERAVFGTGEAPRIGGYRRFDKRGAAWLWPLGR